MTRRRMTPDDREAELAHTRVPDGRTWLAFLELGCMLERVSLARGLDITDARGTAARGRAFSALHAEGKSSLEIARVWGVAESTVSCGVRALRARMRAERQEVTSWAQ